MGRGGEGGTWGTSPPPFMRVSKNENKAYFGNEETTSHFVDYITYALAHTKLYGTSGHQY